MPLRRPLWELQARADGTKDPVRLALLQQEIKTKHKHYAMGWRSAQHQHDLDKAEERYLGTHGERFWHDWLDGWTDWAAGREIGHLKWCAKHDEGRCEDARAKAKGKQNATA